MTKPISILYVDDYSPDRELVRDVLEKEDGGFQVIEAASRAEFETRLGEGNYDLVLSDFNILGFEGLQVIDAVQAEKGPLPVVILTGTGSEEVAVEAMKRGAADYIIKKPHHIQRLPLTLRAVLGRVRAELALKEQSSTLHNIINSVDALIYSVDRQYCYTSFNQAHATVMKTLYGAELEMGHSLLDYITVTKDRETAKTHLDRALSGEQLVEETYSGEESHSRRYYRVSQNPIRNDTSQVIGVAVLAQDLTERKQAEEALRSSERSLAESQRLAHVGSWELNLMNNVLTWSDEIFRIFEIDPQKFGTTYEAFLNTVHPDDREAVNFAYANSLKTKTPYAIDHRLLFADGRIKYVHEQCETLYDGDTPIRSIGTVQDITERKLAEEELQQLTLRNEMILNSAGEGIYGTDINGDIVFMNRAAQDMLGYTMADVIGKNSHQLFHHTRADGKPYPTEACPLRKSLAHGESYRGIDEVFWTRDGRMFPVEHINTPLVNQGTVVGAVVVFRDITERKQNEEALHRLNRELRAISDCNQVLVRAEDEQTLLNDICRIICDEAGYRMAWVGYTEHDEAKTVRPVAWAGAEDGYLATVNVTWADTERGWGPTGTAVRTEASAYIQDFTTDPKAVPWREDAVLRGYRSSIALPLKDENVHTFGALCIYSTEPNVFTPDEIQLLEELASDLAFGVTTLRVRAERKQAEEALRDSERRLTEAQRIAHIGYWERDFEADRITLSDESCHIFGLSPQGFPFNLEQWHQHWLKLIHPEDQPRAAQAAADALKDGPPYNVEYRVVRPDGEVRFIHSEADVKRDEAGRPCFMMGMMQDITEQKRAEEEIRQLNQELEQRVLDRTAQLEAANKELEAFAYSVSHDLRSPLRHIDGFLELLQQQIGEDLDKRSRHYMDAISDAAIRMGQLIDDLLTFSRMGRHELSKTSVDLDALVQEVIEELALEMKGRTIHWQITPLPTVVGDQAMLHQVLVNLLSNALKFTRGCQRIEIEIGCQIKGKEAIIFIRDNGVGFDMAYADKLFGVFQRLHPADEFEGTGIGLANVRQIIKRHNGRTWAEGQNDQGATFYFSLPQTIQGG